MAHDSRQKKQQCVQRQASFPLNIQNMPDTPKDKHALQLILRELTTIQMQFICTNGQ